MTRFRNTYTTLTTFVSAAVLLISTTVPASASPMASDPLSSSTTTAVRAQVTALGANRTYTYVPTNNTSVGDPIVTAYWTPERMKSAIPTDYTNKHDRGKPTDRRARTTGSGRRTSY